jgi:hypothetical protein
MIYGSDLISRLIVFLAKKNVSGSCSEFISGRMITDANDASFFATHR